VVSPTAAAADMVLTVLEGSDTFEQGLGGEFSLPGQAHDQHSSAASSPNASASRPSARPSMQPGSSLEALPDLTDLLKEQGIYEDYLKWQRDYQKWRKGGTKGAQGEMTGQVSVIGQQEDM